MAMTMRQGDMLEVDEGEYQEVYTSTDTTEKQEVYTSTDTTEQHLDMKETEEKDNPNHNKTNTKNTLYRKTKNATKEKDENSEDEVIDKDKDYHKTEHVLSAWDVMRFIDYQVWRVSNKLNRFADGQKLVLALCISILALVTTMVCIIIAFTICKLRKCYINKYR